jgi:hypothetical protein
MIRLASPCLIALSLLACASPAPQTNASPPPPRPSAEIGRADQIAVAALRIAAVDRDPNRALAAIRQATAAAPDRPDLARLSLQFCLSLQGCEAEPYETRLRKLDPGNGVVWLGVLARAQAKRDAQSEQQILQAIGQSQRVDLYWNTLLWRLASAIPPAAPTASGPNLPLTTALNDVTQWLAAAAVPSFQAVTTVCAPERTKDENVRSRCLRVAQALQKGDTALVEGIGLGIAQRLTDLGTPAWNNVQQRIDSLAYQTEAAGAIIRSQVERERFSAEMVELLKKLPREQDVSLAILRWAGQPVGSKPVAR